MVKVGLVLDGTDHFVRPIECHLSRMFEVSRFKPNFIYFPLIGRQINDRRLVRQLRRFLDQHDVVFFEWGGPLAALASHCSPESKKIVRMHRTEIFSELKKFNWPTVDRVILVSQAMRARFLQSCPQGVEQSSVVYYGIDVERFAVRPKPFAWRLGMLGNLTPRKRVYDVICMLAELPGDIPWQLSVGGGPIAEHLDYYDALQVLVAELNVTDRVHFCGRVAEPAAWFHEIDVFVSASYSEGHQNALLEAMASGNYCLSHGWDGVEEMLPPENIFLTGAELRAKLLDYAAMSECEQQQVCARMRSIVEEKFREERMVSEIVELIESVVRG